MTRPQLPGRTSTGRMGCCPWRHNLAPSARREFPALRRREGPFWVPLYGRLFAPHRAVDLAPVGTSHRPCRKSRDEEFQRLLSTEYALPCSSADRRDMATYLRRGFPTSRTVKLERSEQLSNLCCPLTFTSKKRIQRPKHRPYAFKLEHSKRARQRTFPKGHAR